MKQTDINQYEKILNESMTEYLASQPDPAADISIYVQEREYLAQGDKDQEVIPISWFDSAAMTSVIRHHKDTKDQYDVHACTIELMTTLFRMACYKIGWLDDEDASTLASYLSYEKPMTKQYMQLLHDFTFCIRRFPYNEQQCKWYTYLLPLLAYSKQTRFTKSNYIVRYLLSMIDKIGLTPSKGEHKRDVDTDFLRCIRNLAPLMSMCKTDHTIISDESRYTLYRNVLSEFSAVFLACLLQRSAVNESFGIIAKEVVAQHHIEFQLIANEYHKQRRS